MSVIEEALRRTQPTAGQDAKRQDRPATEAGTPPPGGVAEGSAETRSVRPTEPGNPAKLGGRGSPVAEGGGTVPLPSLPSPGGGRLQARIEKGWLVGGSALMASVVIWGVWVYVAPATGRLRRPVAVAPPPAAQVVQMSVSPAIPEPLPQPTLRLSGIVGGAGEPLAIINGMIVRVGEMVTGATLLEVGENFARLRWRDQDVILRTGE